MLKALARNPADRWADAADMANALDDIVHAARFQPTHLAQLLYDLFPTEAGGSRPTAPHTTLHGTTTGSSSIRSASASLAPTSYTSSGAGPAPLGPSADAVLKPKSRSTGVLVTLVLLAAAGGAGWKVYGHKLLGQMSPASAAPSRRFFVYVKSEPAGANIFRVDNNTLMGATPVTLPIELVGQSSVRIRLEKARLRELRADRHRQRPDLDLADADGWFRGRRGRTGSGGAKARSPSPSSRSDEEQRHRRRRARARRASRFGLTTVLDGGGPQANAALVFRGLTVAVVIPAFNEADKIQATLGSVPRLRR